MKKLLLGYAILAVLLAITTRAQSDDGQWKDSATYVPGSTQKICQVTGETDQEFGTFTVSRTATRYGMAGADLGYSFEHNGMLFFLFGDAAPTKTFNGYPNGRSDPPRDPNYDDAIGFTSLTHLTTCPKLDFIPDSIGAYQSPVLAPVTLRTNEMPIAGISEGGRMYVIFGTDNPYANPPYSSPPPLNGIQNLDAGPTRTVVGVSDDNAHTFRYLYDFSTSDLTSLPNYNAKFIYTAIARGHDEYLYIWGSEGGLQFRNSLPCLARKKAFLMDQPGETEYFAGLGADGHPLFSWSERDAVPLFADYDGPNFTPKNCMAHKGVQWNPYVELWVMLYDCSDETPQNLPGIYMRTAEQLWGPWSVPQTIFNAKRDNGSCVFIYSDSSGPCPNPGGQTAAGGNYAPYFIAPLATGDERTATSTFYWTMATFDPYTQVIMKTTIQGPQEAGSTSGKYTDDDGFAP
jgi:hypothetical protein